MSRALAAAALGAVSCRGHATITWPPSRHGATKAASCNNSACNWFTQLVHIPGEPTNNAPQFRTVNVNVNRDDPSDWSRRNPWRAPGTAPVWGSGCGVAGGGALPYDGTGPGVAPGAVLGQDGQTLPPTQPTVWKAGSVQEVAMGINSNHAGGYSWRLCKDDRAGSPRGAQAAGPGERAATPARAHIGGPPKDNNIPDACVADTCDKQGCKKCSATLAWSCDECCDGCWKNSQGPASPNVTGFTCSCPPPNPVPPVPLNPAVNEACFQRNTLRFATNSSWIEWVNGTRREFPLRKVTEGTFPAGSEWARIPVPGCRMCDQYEECGGAPALPGNNTHDMEFLNYAWCSGYCLGQSQKGADGQTTCPPGTEQYPAVAGLSGYGYGWGAAGFDWNIVDKVQVPEDLEPGHYLLSWRWDCEQTPQVWQNCADIRIEV